MADLKNILHEAVLHAEEAQRAASEIVAKFKGTEAKERAMLENMQSIKGRDVTIEIAKAEWLVRNAMKDLRRARQAACEAWASAAEAAEELNAIWNAKEFKDD